MRLLNHHLIESVRQLRSLSIYSKKPIDFGFDFLTEKEVIFTVFAETLLIGFSELILTMASVAAILLEIIPKCSYAEWWTNLF